jgi:hypothetical protein
MGTPSTGGESQMASAIGFSPVWNCISSIRPVKAIRITLRTAMGRSATMISQAVSTRPAYGDTSALVPLQNHLAVELPRQEGD